MPSLRRLKHKISLPKIKLPSISIASVVGGINKMVDNRRKTAKQPKPEDNIDAQLEEQQEVEELQQEEEDLIAGEVPKPKHNKQNSFT